MDPQRLLEALLELAHQVGLEVRSQGLRGTRPSAGGVCRINGRELVLLNSKTSPVERAAVLGDALVRKDLSRFELLPDVRRFLAMRSRSVRGTITPANLPGPGLAKAESHQRRRV